MLKRYFSIALFINFLLTLSLGIYPSLAQSALKFKPPSRGTPPVTKGLASRGTVCFSEQDGPKKLKALVPSNNFGLTTAKNASLMIYVPKSSAKFLAVQLNSQDNKTKVFHKEIPVPINGGIIRILMKDMKTPPLQVDKNYLWTATLVCQENDYSKNPITQGWVQRIQPDMALNTILNKATPTSLPGIYAKAGVWHDALTSLDNLRVLQPNNNSIARDWTSLLTSVGLTEFSKFQIIR
jgi:hypothetical protein